MTRFLLAVMLAAATPAIAQADPAGQADYVRAEIRGTLTFEAGRGYVVTVKTTRVWLRISENKVLVRQLESLTNKTVTVRGALQQMDTTSRGSVPSGALYVDDFTIDAAK